MSEPVFEVVVTTAQEGVVAAANGANRLELAAGLQYDGLTPSPAEFARLRDAVDVPVRVMLRDRGGFQLAEPARLSDLAFTLRAEGANEFVLGFLTPDGEFDQEATLSVLEPIAGCRWTFHRAVDHAADRAAVRRAIDGMPGLDTLLTAGARTHVGDGLGTLLREAALRGAPGHRVEVMAGGGLSQAHVAPLRARGVNAFHVGTAVRHGGWDSGVNEAAVRHWRDVIESAPSTRGA